jgi:hypothetical protein
MRKFQTGGAWTLIQPAGSNPLHLLDVSGRAKRAPAFGAHVARPDRIRTRGAEDVSRQLSAAPSTLKQTPLLNAA